MTRDSFILADAGNTYNPALLVLRCKGYELELEQGRDRNFWNARKDHRLFSAFDPVALLGLIGIWEHFGDDWNQQTPSVLDELLE